MVNKALKIMWIILLASAACAAQQNSVEQLFQRILSNSSGPMPSTEELFTTVNEVSVAAMPAAQLQRTLLLGRQCLQSSRAEVRQAGMVLFISTVTRGDSARFLEGYADDLGSLLAGPEGAISLRHASLYVLGSMKPQLPPKAVAHLSAHLEDNRNSDEEALTIAASLIDASPSDSVTVQRALRVVARRAQPGLTAGVLRQLGLSKSKAPEALDFVATSLQDSDVHIRASAVDAASRMDKYTRQRFAARLQQIASDPSEPEHTRDQAKTALQP